mgnify:FL=1
MSYQSLVDFNGWTLIAQILNLFIQMYLFKRFLFQPVKKIFEQRQQEVDTLYSDAETAKQDAETAKESYETHLRTAAAEADAITSRAVASAKLSGDQIGSAATAEADAMREKASREIELERRKTMDELKGEISGLAVEIASKVAEKEIGEQEHEALIEKFIDELGD